jgi:hypothetical protein
MLTIKNVIHIDLSDLFQNMKMKNEKVPEYFDQFIKSLGLEDLECGDVKMICFDDYTEQDELFEAVDMVQGFLSFFYNIYDKEICLEMNSIKLW